MQNLRENIKKLLRGDVIEVAVVDFRALNKSIATDSVPLPDIHSAFHWFAKAKYFTT